MRTCLILIYYSTFRPPNSITHGELTDSCSYTRRISCTPHTQGQSQNHRLPSTAFRHSRTHRSQPKTFLITLQIIYMPRAQALFWESSTFQTFQSQPILSLSPYLDFCSKTTILGLPGAAENLVSGQARSTTDLTLSPYPSPPYCSSFNRPIDLSPQKLSSASFLQNLPIYSSMYITRSSSSTKKLTSFFLNTQFCPYQLLYQASSPSFPSPTVIPSNH
jgi:hypothetical protein